MLWLIGIGILVLFVIFSLGSSTGSSTSAKTKEPEAPLLPPQGDRFSTPRITQTPSRQKTRYESSPTVDASDAHKKRFKFSSKQVKFLGEDELVVRILRPLKTKGKLGRTHTTPIENLYSKGIPSHQIGDCKDLVEKLIRTGVLEEKVSQGRRHVWLTNLGLREFDIVASKTLH